MIAAYIHRYRAALWTLLHPRAIECDLARHFVRIGATETGRVR